MNRSASRRSLALLATALGSFGCTAPTAQDSQDPTAAPTVTASASASASAEPTPSVTLEPSPTPVPTLAFEAPDDILPPASIVVVAVDTLQLRGAPGLSAAVVGTASAGERFYVLGEAFGSTLR